MNKKGFTLTELLVVIAIIGVLTVIIVPSVTKINESINERMYDQRKEYIVTAAELYASNNPDIFNGSDTTVVQVWELLSQGYLTVDSNDETCDLVWNVERNVEENIDANYKLSIGCVSDPRYSTSLNGLKVLLTKKTVGVVAEIDVDDDDIDSARSDTLVNKVCDGFEKGSFIGKYGTGENDYCMCSADHAFLVKATYDGKTMTRASGDVDACILVSNDKNGNINNWLKYGSSSANWRVVGLYMIPQSGSATKLITPKVITSSVID